jgi:hypothetical protein
VGEFKVTSDVPDWIKAIRDKQQPVAEAAVAALRDVAAESVQEGRKDIAAAGPNFRTNWQEGLKYGTKNARQNGKALLTAQATIYHRYGIAGVFEFGAVISGKPMLWIPTTRGGPTPKKSGKKLVSATVNGQPMLFDAGDKDRHRKPLYIGVPTVTIKKKFHITEIVKENVKKMGKFFIKNFKDG